MTSRSSGVSSTSSSATLRAAAAGVLDDARGEDEGIGRRAVLLRVAAGEGEELGEHPLHLVDVLAQALGLLALVHQRQRQLHPGQRRAQVVADARQHRGALLDLPLDARAHVQKRAGRAADLLGAGGAERQRTALAEGLGGFGELADRPDLVAQEGDGDGAEHDRGDQHQHQQLVRVGHAEPGARRLDQQHALVGLRPRSAPGVRRPEVDRERPVDLLAQRRDQRPAGQVERARAARPA